MNRMIGAIMLGMLTGSVAVIYLGLVIATPQIPEQVKALQATLVSEVAQNMAGQPAVQEQNQAVPNVPVVQFNTETSAVSVSTSDNCALHSSYPGSVRQWCALIQAAAAEHHLDPNLVAAVMQQESGGDPNAYSGSGAVGLLQVMPSDGIAASFYCVAGPCFAGRPSSQQLFDPQFNITYGTQMLAGLVNRYQDVRQALVSYGPANVGTTYADTVLAIYAAQ